MIKTRVSSLPKLLFLCSLSLFAFFSCEKSSPTLAEEAEEATVVDKPGNGTITKSGCLDYFAITEAPNSEIIHLQGGSYTLIGTTTLTATSGGDPIYISDLKGISRFADAGYYVTTGPNNPAPYDNALLEIDPFSGTVLRHVMNIGSTVSDICFVDSTFGPFFGFVGLGNNNNSLVWLPVPHPSGPVGMPVGIGLVDIEPGYTASGLTWAYPTDPDPLCRQDFQLYVTATSPLSNKAHIYEVDPSSGATVFYANLIGQELQGTHTACGWSYCKQEFQFGHLTKALNAHTFSVGLLNCHNKPGPWPNAIVRPIQPNAYEDFCSEPYAF